MKTHGLSGFGLVVVFYSHDDGLMRIDGSLTSPCSLERLLPAVAQDLQQSRNKFFDGVVLRAPNDGKVKFAIRFNSSLTTMHLFSLLVEEVPHSLNISRSCSFCRQTCYVRLDEFAQFEDIG